MREIERLRLREREKNREEKKRMNNRGYWSKKKHTQF